jgi:hypothetical protein
MPHSGSVNSQHRHRMLARRVRMERIRSAKHSVRTPEASWQAVMRQDAECEHTGVSAGSLPADLMSGGRANAGTLTCRLGRSEAGTAKRSGTCCVPADGALRWPGTDSILNCQLATL